MPKNARCLICIVTAAYAFGLGASVINAQTNALRDDFSNPTLDPAWTVETGVPTTSYSLTAAPGFLRYAVTGDTTFAGGPPLKIYRQFSGTQWTFETRVTYAMPAGLGRQLLIHVLLGDLSASGVNEALWWHDRDDGGGSLRLRVVGQFVDGGASGIPNGFGGDGTLGYAIAASANDTYWVRIVRDDQQLTMLESQDGVTYMQVLQRTFTATLGSLQTILIDGRSFFATGTADYDYVSVTPARSVCLLYDPTKAAKAGSTIPIKLQLCSTSGVNLSSPDIALHATGISIASSTIAGPVEDSGDANPDADFRYDSTLGATGGYIFNLSTKGLITGTYNLTFTVAGSSSEYIAPFQVK